MATAASTTSTTPTTTRDTQFYHPLTTLFTPPSSCLQDPFTLYTSQANIVGFSSAWRDRNETSSECYPSSFSTFQFYWTWYSPGVCPSGYTKAQTRTTISTTQAWCCPSGMLISGSGIYQFCSSFIATPTQALIARTTLSGDVLADISTVSSTASFIALQWPLSVEWEQSDLTLFTPASAPILTTTMTASGSVTSAPATSTAASDQASTSGLSTGAKAGIGVGAAVAVVLVIAAVVLLCMRRRRGRAESITSYQDTKQGHQDARRTPTYELEASPPSKYELDGTSSRLELESPLTPKYGIAH